MYIDMKFAIQVEGLSKQYKIGAIEKHTTFHEAIIHSFKASFKALQRSNGRCPDNTIWALKDVSFSVNPGEIVGIIGRNGSGKSTLLKILSQITEPTRGFAEIRGRVGSLLEVGIGFHGELTGRENIYLNGAILGMRKKEIASKLDEIISFAEVEKFIDTPVKRYSSGMYLRLAFSVAAHLEPEILIVDEVLAVGDMEFQKKCLGKMDDVGKQGRTVLFVSHNMPAVMNLCKLAILLERGSLVAQGPTHEVVRKYLTYGLDTAANRTWDNSNSPTGEIARLRAVRIKNQKGQPADSIDVRESFGIEMEYEVLKPGYMLLPYYDLYKDGTHALAMHDIDPMWCETSRETGIFKTTTWIYGNLLSEGIFLVTAGLVTQNPEIKQFEVHDAVSFYVVDCCVGKSARGNWKGPLGGAVVRPLLQWETVEVERNKKESPPEL